MRALSTPARLRLRRAAVYLADDSPDTETMLFEAALDDIMVDVAGDVVQGHHQLSLQVCSAQHVAFILINANSCHVDNAVGICSAMLHLTSSLLG